MDRQTTLLIFIVSLIVLVAGTCAFLFVVFVQNKCIDSGKPRIQEDDEIV